MGATSIWHWVILLVIVVLLFGRGKISEVMGDVAKGIKSFKKGMSDDETADAGKPGTQDAKTIPSQNPESADAAKTESSKAG